MCEKVDDTPFENSSLNKQIKNISLAVDIITYIKISFAFDMLVCLYFVWFLFDFCLFVFFFIFKPFIFLTRHVIKEEILVLWRYAKSLSLVKLHCDIYSCKLADRSRRFPFQSLLHQGIGEGATLFSGFLTYPWSVSYNAEC